MNIRKTLLAAALAAFAFGVLPGVASAYEMDLPENPEFTMEGGEMKLTTPSATVTCSSVSGEGEFENGKTGWERLRAHGCQAAGTSCKSAGQANGTIETTLIAFHTGTRKRAGKSSPAKVTTDDTLHYSTFTCAFGLVKIELGGNGVVGGVTSPEVEVPSNSSTIDFETEGGQQVDTEADIGSGMETFELEASINGGEAEPAGLDASITSSFVEGGEGTLTE